MRKRARDAVGIALRPCDGAEGGRGSRRREFPLAARDLCAPRTPGRSGAVQQGFSMIEMIISVAIGLVVTGAVLYTVTGATASGRKQDVQARMHDMGQMALNQLTEHARMAGFWMPPSEVTAGDALLDNELPIRGCDGGFEDVGAAWNALKCRGATGTRSSDGLALRFQVQEGGRNWDCAGNDILNASMLAEAQAAAQRNNKTAPNVTAQEVIEERYFVADAATGNPGLFCRSSAQAAGDRAEQIVDNVEQFRVRYGLSPLNAETNTHNSIFDLRSIEGRTARYVSASALTTNCSSSNRVADSWCSVNSVRICVVLRSEDNAVDQPNAPYVDCDGHVQTQNDRRFRQAFSTTVAIRNRISTP
ncbi:MAG: PilW family protein [Lautropia sp.]|nr:PilW family protein [Lautropia sp.]